MSVQLGTLLAQLESWYAPATADDWDAPGLVTGSTTQPVSRVLLTVDITTSVIDEACELGADVIIAHHPYLLRGVQSLDESLAKGANLAKAIRANIAIYSAHTNADIAVDGVSQALADLVGLRNPVALSNGEPTGHGRVGAVEKSTLGALAQRVAAALPATAGGVRVAGDFNQEVSRVALCAGAGDSLIGAAIQSGADVYITSDLRHHPAQDAREHAILAGGRPALIDISHWAAEYVWLDGLARRLRDAFGQIEFMVSDVRTDPWDFLVTQ
ncbi:MAG: hypothetical protein RLZZ626_255 [Actinomycetota bacterium]|jgi:dinuclear metal center YbgI/SA1388 family protein